MTPRPPFDWRAAWPHLIAALAFVATLVLIVSVFAASCRLEQYRLPFLASVLQKHGYLLDDFCALSKRILLTVLLIPVIVIGHTLYPQLGQSRGGCFWDSYRPRHFCLSA